MAISFPSLLGSISRTPTQDNKILDSNNEGQGADIDKEILAGIPGVGPDIPVISHKSTIGACLFAFNADGLRVPNDLRETILNNPRIKSLTTDYKNIGYALVSGFKYGSIYYVNSDRQYAGGSIGGFKLPFTDPRYNFFGFGVGTTTNQYGPNSSIPSFSVEAPHIDTRLVYAQGFIGGKNISIGVMYGRHSALIDDVQAGNSNEWKARFEILDIEKLFRNDTDLSIGLVVMASDKQEYTFVARTGTLDLAFRFNKNGFDSIEPMIQGGFSF